MEYLGIIQAGALNKAEGASYLPGREQAECVFASLSIRRTPGGYLAYLGVFVQPVHRFTRLYMGTIAPFRRLVVYPALIRTMQRAWAERYDRESGIESRLTG